MTEKEMANEIADWIMSSNEVGMTRWHPQSPDTVFVMTEDGTEFIVTVRKAN